MDLAMNLNVSDPGYGDVIIKNGDLQVTSDVDPTGTNYVLQDILQRIRTFRGEWFMDNRDGLPYHQEIFRKNPDLAGIELAFTSEILGTPGVYRLLRFALDFNRTTRHITVSFVVSTQAGVVTYTGPAGGTPT